MTAEKEDEINRLKAEMGRYIGLGNNSLNFQFEDLNGSWLLRLITINPKHNQSFLFHTSAGETQLEAIQEMLNYVKAFKEDESSYTIQWTLLGEQSLHTSYFRAKNVIGALDKLYFGRDPNSITVFSVIMNPIS
jgi:hypothetical protein